MRSDPMPGRLAEVWWARPYDAPPSALAVLSEVELARADQLRDPAERRRVLTARVLLRAAVGERTGLSPAEVPVVRRCADCGGPHGKPVLAWGEPLELSVTHAGDRVGVAISAGVPLGLDVEPLDQSELTPEMTGLVCTPAEKDWLTAHPDSARNSLFLALWTAKEALLKAVGTGLNTPMTEVEVACPAPGGPLAGRVLQMPGGVPAWLHPVDPGSGHVGSLASLGQLDEIRESDGAALLARL